LSGFSLARTETTVRQFRRFAQATGSLTHAERRRPAFQQTVATFTRPA